LGPQRHPQTTKGVPFSASAGSKIPILLRGVLTAGAWGVLEGHNSRSATWMLQVIAAQSWEVRNPTVTGAQGAEGCQHLCEITLLGRWALGFKLREQMVWLPPDRWGCTPSLDQTATRNTDTATRF
jgi:hypothetical protein